MKYGILHNRKTAGTALKAVLDQQNERAPINAKYLGHAVTFPKFIADYPNAEAIFFVRDPISRFISGFYSRQRQGLPRYYFAWTSKEKKAFARFATPNQLAESLSSMNIIKRFQAISAMRSIGHIRHTYSIFFGPLAFLQKNQGKIAFIGHQPDFDLDLQRLRSLLKIDADIKAPQDDIGAHRNPLEVDKSLSELATSNLLNWYKRDYEIYEWCLQKREALLA